jgi:hypothetical protein
LQITANFDLISLRKGEESSSDPFAFTFAAKSFTTSSDKIDKTFDQLRHVRKHFDEFSLT